MRILLTPAALLILTSTSALAAEPCQKIHGRVVLYTADSQLRLWHIGTDHEFEPDYNRADKGASWDRITDILKAGDESAGAAGNNALFGDFLVCPTQRYRKGAVQTAIIRHMSHTRIVPRDQDGEPR